HFARSRVGRNADDEPIGVEFRREGAALLDLVGRTALGEGRKFVGQGKPRAKIQNCRRPRGRATQHSPSMGAAHYIGPSRGNDAPPARGITFGWGAGPGAAAAAQRSVPRTMVMKRT